MVREKKGGKPARLNQLGDQPKGQSKKAQRKASGRNQERASKAAQSEAPAAQARSPKSSRTGRLKLGLVLSGVAPSMTLMAGAMRGFAEEGVEFDVISTTGVGGLVAMTYLAPNGGKSPEAALHDLSELYVSDALYSLIPMNFKAFQKYGRFSEPAWRLGKAIPRFPVRDKDGRGDFARLANDWIDMWITALTPSTLTMACQGLMSHAPIVKDLIDFEKLKDSKTRFYLNAFNNSDRRLEMFCNKDENRPITVDRYEAAQSMLFLFPPKHIGSKVYSIGATHEPTGLQALWCNHRDVGERKKTANSERKQKEIDDLDAIIVLDPMTKAYVREPTDIYDAFQLMLMGPVAALQENIMIYYAESEFHFNENKEIFKGNIPRLFCLPFEQKIKQNYFPEMFKWSRSNALKLHEIGHEAAKEFSEHIKLLKNKIKDAEGNERDRVMETSTLNSKYRYHDKLLYQTMEAKHNSIGDYLGILVEAVNQKIPLDLPPCGPDRQDRSEHTPPSSRQISKQEGDTTCNEDWWVRKSRKAVLLCGGAPTLHMSAGAMCAFYEKKFSFDIVATSGAGALPGLLYAAPKNKDQVAALRSTIDLNIDDLIFDIIPSNFKVFQKQGPFTELFWEMGRRLPRYEQRSSAPYIDSMQRLYNDWLDFVVAAITPTTLNYTSKGVCTRITQLLDEIVDWDAIENYPKEYALNAFDLKEQQLRLFKKKDLNPQTFFAALAMPWLFEPVKVLGSTFTEGATHDPTALEALWREASRNDNKIDSKRIDQIIVVESITSEMWNDPRNLYDSLRLTIMDPVVSLAEQMLAIYGKFEYMWNGFIESYYNKSSEEVPPEKRMPKLYVVPCEVPQSQSPKILEWSRANGELLWAIGHEEASEFCKAFNSGEEREQYRYYYRLECGRIESRQKWARLQPFLELVDPFFDQLTEKIEQGSKKQLNTLLDDHIFDRLNDLTKKDNREVLQGFLDDSAIDRLKENTKKSRLDRLRALLEDDDPIIHQLRDLLRMSRRNQLKALLKVKDDVLDQLIELTK